MAGNFTQRAQLLRDGINAAKTAPILTRAQLGVQLAEQSAELVADMAAKLDRIAEGAGGV